MTELEADLAARQEKIMANWVESFTTLTESHKNGKLAAYAAKLTLLMNSFFTKNELTTSR